MKDVRITTIELAKVTHDRWYDAVTMRVWATKIEQDDSYRG